MNLKIIHGRVTHGIGDLSRCKLLNRCLHGCEVFFRTALRKEAHHCGDSLGNIARRHYDQILVLDQAAGLLCSKNNVLIVRENENSLRVNFRKGIQNIFGARIHGLTARDNPVHADFLEDMVQTLTRRNCQKAVRLFLRRLGLFTLLFRSNL